MKEREPFTGVGISLYSVGRQAGALNRAAELSLERVVDTECWRNGLDPTHPLRKQLAGPELDWRPGKRLDLGAEELSDESAAEMAEAQIDAIVDAGGTWLEPSVHPLSEHVPLSLARRNEIKLAHATAEEARSRGPAPAPAGLPEQQRSVVCAIGLDLKVMSERSPRELVAAYSEVKADIYVLRLWQFSRTAKQYARARRIARMLQEKTGKRCVVDGAGPLSYALLRNRVDGVVLGPGRARIRLDPSQPTDDDEEIKRAVFLWAPKLLRTLPLGEGYEPTRKAVFAQMECKCDAHPKSKPPESHADGLKHNFHWEKLEIVEALASRPQDVKREFGARVRAAIRRRTLLQLGGIETAWLESLETYQRDDRDQAAGEGAGA